MGLRAGIGRIVRLPVKWGAKAFPRLAEFLFTAGILLDLALKQVIRKTAAGFKVFGGQKKKPRLQTRKDVYGKLLLWMLNRIEQLRDALGDGKPLQGSVLRPLLLIGGGLARRGRLSLAERFYEAAGRNLPRFSIIRFDVMRTLGINRFMQGKMPEALPCFAEPAETKYILRSRPQVPQTVRMLADSWFVALGHVAMLELLIKKQRLGWEDPSTVFFTTMDLRKAPGQTLLLELARLGIRFDWPENIRLQFDRLVEDQTRRKEGSPPEDAAASGKTATSEKTPPLKKPGGPRTWDYLDDVERTALIEEFWEWYFPDGQGLYYGPAAAKIQNRWEAEKRPPLLSRSAESNEALTLLRRQLGIPDGAWYVCLHVRQSGFHGKWNKVWEQARDAKIETYTEAIRAIVARGGYVVRMGDPSMPALPPMNRVIDYARSDFKAEHADILLLSGARFFAGTNSGLSMVPGIYGVPCVLSNWVPIGIPNWFGPDLMVPKLLRRKATGAIVPLDEMLGTPLGYLQNPQDLPEGVEFVENTPQELKLAVDQMMDELDGDASESRDVELEEAYFARAVKHGSYRGSRIGTAFMREHGERLGFSWPLRRTIDVAR